EKGDELGYFRFGGSFVATLFEPGKIVLAEDLVKNSAEGRETYAKMGTTLGVPAE
ncbi:MAG: phosphatidylserine decarboxylase, partial [Opitutales bacterium]|nr:phosphatidylserine decarboxylase [Opitutales bacterium]